MTDLNQIEGIPELKKEEQTKAYTIGTISIDAQGIWHLHYIGHHEVLKKKYFGNGLVSDRNIRKLLNIVGSRLNNKKQVYEDKIKEVETNEK